MMEEDQKARFAYIAKPDKSLDAAMQAIDRKTTARMKAIVAKHGWPGMKLVGEDGAHAAWLLVQHADQDVVFQKQCLALLEAALVAQDVDAQNYAYLYDRVAVAEKRPQRWGTQFMNGTPQPIEDEANVDARRTAIGLSTMEQYKADMRRMYGDRAANR
jgi:dienelactone hydrolase